MADLVRFVDSIAASPTVRLNVNDEVTWWVKSFSAPPPRLRRSMSSNAMRDGAHMSASNYEPRTITLELEVRTSTQDATATEMQTLWRELDRESNFLMYQPTGATKPVFFRLYRSDASQIEDVLGQAAMRRFTIDLLAEPFALGLKETLGPYTVNNNPAHATNGCYFDASGVLGDVATPVVWWESGSAVIGNRAIAVTHTTVAPTLKWVQCETGSPFTDTSNPGGGPDAAMSGTGTNNYLRTTFATNAAMTARVSLVTILSNTVGQYRAFLWCRRSGVTSTIQVTATNLSQTTTIPATTARQLVDLGLVSRSDSSVLAVGYAATDNATSGAAGIELKASRTGGTDTFDWDAVILLPVGGQPGEKVGSTLLMTSAFNAQAVIDSMRGSAFNSDGGDPTLGLGTFAMSTFAISITGGFPTIAPSVVNRVHLLTAGVVTSAATVNLAYWPRYLHARPSVT